VTRLVELRVSAEPYAWREAGVPLDGLGLGWLGSVLLRVDPKLGPPGLRSWMLDVRPASISDVDGLPTDVGPAPSPLPPDLDGILGVTGIDHVVVLTPDLDRTVAAIEQWVGVPLLRTRDGEAGGSPARQAFFRLGDVILEVVAGGSPGTIAGPVRFYGLALTVSDLDAAARHLGDRLGPVKPAVQRDRWIATVRREAGLGAAVALMSPAPERR
jgi:Glyoxalase/Bleomycin resistance protein/Dioxygenase superfamily